jgi:hypothetical protein
VDQETEMMSRTDERPTFRREDSHELFATERLLAPARAPSLASPGAAG